jgi:hypothetical protein
MMTSCVSRGERRRKGPMGGPVARPGERHERVASVSSALRSLRLRGGMSVRWVLPQRPVGQP